MRSPVDSSPVFDCLQVRIAPSTVAVTIHGALPAPSSVSTMDDTGSPGTEPDGDGSYPIILSSPGGTTPGTVC